MRAVFPSLILILSLFLSACGEQGTFRPFGRVDDSSGLNQLLNFRLADVGVTSAQPVPLDILWVIDNSGSMGAYQAAVKSNVQNFVVQLSAKAGLSWKMGILSTDFRNAPFLGLSGAPSFTSANSSQLSVFTSAVDRLGINGSGVEQTFDPVNKALTNDPNFLTPDSVLAIIVVSDAPEQSFLTNWRNFLDTMIAKKGSAAEVVVYGAFGAQDLGCAQTDDRWNYNGSSYANIVNATNGRYFPLCSSNFGSSLTAVAQNAAARTTGARIRLPVPAVSGSIAMSCQGLRLPGEGSSGGIWRYIESENLIEIYDTTSLTDPNATISVTFTKKI